MMNLVFKFETYLNNNYKIFIVTMIKNLYCIRNAINFNNKITTNGVSQINTLRKSWKDINDIDLVLLDTDQKSYNTAKGIFDTTPFISINILHSPDFHLSNIVPDKDITFMYSTKPPYLFDKGYPDRVKMFYKFLETRQENNIAYVGHQKFINHLTSFKEKQPLKRCHPYLHELSFNLFCDN